VKETVSKTDNEKGEKVEGAGAEWETYNVVAGFVIEKESDRDQNSDAIGEEEDANGCDAEKALDELDELVSEPEKEER
jgi:hypothetical protein